MFEVRGHAEHAHVRCLEIKARTRCSKSISNGVIFPSQSDRKSADISQADAFTCTSVVQL